MGDAINFCHLTQDTSGSRNSGECGRLRTWIALAGYQASNKNFMNTLLNTALHNLFSIVQTSADLDLQLRLGLSQQASEELKSTNFGLDSKLTFKPSSFKGNQVNKLWFGL